MNHAVVPTPPSNGQSFVSAALVVGTLLLAPAAAIHAQPATQVELELVLSGLSATVDLQNAGDNRLFAVGQEGIVRIVSIDATGDATLLATPFLDISDLVKTTGHEQGLLGLAFHPEYDPNGFLFVNYTCLASAPDCANSGDTIIARYSVSANPDLADPGSGLVVATIPQDAGNHNGGQLQFEPFPDPDKDRTILYIGLGDGGGGDDPNQNAQNLNSLLGKMLRVDVDNLDGSAPLPRYHIPADNPSIEGFVDEIWAYGLRNPWRFSFDRETGDLFIGDVGQNAREEINFQAAASVGGENYGWRQCEGTRVNFDDEATAGCTDDADGITPPILEYTHAEGCSVTGGYIYRGVAFGPELGGTYFYADHCSGRLWGARSDAAGNWINEIVEETGPNTDITTFGESHLGEIYLATLTGELYRIRPPDSPETDLIVTAVDGPTEGVIGGVIFVTSTGIRNQSASPAGATEVGYYFTTDPAGQPDQTSSGSVCPVPVLVGGATYNCQNIMVNVPGSLAAGQYRLVAIVDDQDLVAEIDETNNHLADPQPIQLSQSACFPTGDSCASDAQCCSLKCRGGKNKTCKGDTTCTPSEIPESSCTDGQDNDCDGLTDAEDPDCPGGGICEPKGATCSAHDECCSNKCRGPSGRQSCK